MEPKWCPPPKDREGYGMIKGNEEKSKMGVRGKRGEREEITDICRVLKRQEQERVERKYLSFHEIREEEENVQML